MCYWYTYYWLIQTRTDYIISYFTSIYKTTVAESLNSRCLIINILFMGLSCLSWWCSLPCHCHFKKSLCYKYTTFPPRPTRGRTSGLGVLPEPVFNSVEEAWKRTVCLSCVIYSNVVAGDGGQLTDRVRPRWLFLQFSARTCIFFLFWWMNAALCVSQENYGSRQLGAQAGAAADLHLFVTPIWALSLLRRSRPHDSFRLSVRRGDLLQILQSASLVWSGSPPGLY